MTYQRNAKSLTAERLLDRMEVGRTYRAYQLAGKFNLATCEVKPLLESLINSREVEVGQVAGGAGGYRRPRSDAAGESAIALPRTFTAQRCELAGYDAEFARRVALCLSVRG